jgi:hypothetical protein
VTVEQLSREWSARCIVPMVPAFRRGLSEQGYEQDRNVAGLVPDYMTDPAVNVHGGLVMGNWEEPAAMA